MPNIKQKAVNGMLWSVGERLSMQVALVLTSIILARLLEPSDFGLLGMLAIFTAIAQSIIDSGFGTALIRKKDLNEVDKSSIFFFNLLIGTLLGFVLFLSSPLIAIFYSQPSLIPITRVISSILILNSFSLVQASLLTREMKFNIQFKIGLISVLVSGAVGILMALMGFGVWSLVAQLLTRSLVNSLFLWILSKWRPSLAFSIQSLKVMFAYGSRLLFAGIVETLFKNIYQTFIGRIFSATELGFYTKALTLETAATQSTTSSLSKVTFAALVPFQDDNHFLKKSYRKTIKLSMLIQFPLLFALIAMAEPLIILLLSDRWAPSIPYFQLLCVVGIFQTLVHFNTNILKIKGRTDLIFRLLLLNKATIIAAIAITYRWGISALIIGQVFSALIFSITLGHFSDNLIGYSQIEQIKDFLPPIIIGSIVSLCMYSVNFLGLNNYILKFLLMNGVGLLVFLLISLFYQSEEFKEVKKIIKVKCFELISGILK